MLILIPDTGEKNKHRYVLATQSQPLRSKMRSIPAVPIVHINRSVMILEPPSDATIRAKNMVGFSTLPSHKGTDNSDQTEQQALMPSVTELAQIASTSKIEDVPPKKKRKGPKGPNPLSVKKKQKDAPSGAAKPKKPHDPLQKVGEKRKRDEDVRPEGAEGREGFDEPTSGHKRKRRRKAASAAEHGVPVAE